MKHTFVLAAALAAACTGLAGCASLTEAGHTSYKVMAVHGPDGKPSGYELQVSDGKELEGRQVMFQAKGDAVVLTVAEGQSKAFKGQAIGAKALSVLPVTSLQDILK